MTPALSAARELLEVARMVMQRKQDEILINKVTVLQGYVELSQMCPNDDYGPTIRRAMSEVTAAIWI